MKKTKYVLKDKYKRILKNIILFINISIITIYIVLIGILLLDNTILLAIHSLISFIFCISYSLNIKDF